jgi:diketogulonate reductase-like aldo/keto reductase
MEPTFIYGTAWKEDDTERLTALALEQGFRAIDTANQRKHYFEAGVGAALKRSGLPREAVWLQTKFTFVDGQDHRLPYDPKARIATQVEQSFASSLEHLGVTWLDSYVLHGPSSRFGWQAEDREAWAAMEALQRRGTVKALGVSNVSAEQLEALLAEAAVKPRWVQNRCYARTGWDEAVRAVCARHDVRYQGFSLLTANPQVLQSAEVRAEADRLGRTPAQVVFQRCVALGILPLTGTKDPEHMRQDLEAIAN